LNIIDQLTEYRELLRELEELMNPEFEGKLTIMIPDKTVISLHWEVPPNEGGRHFHDQAIALADLDGVMRNLKERVRYWKEKQNQ